jgi:hypothetical protein
LKPWANRICAPASSNFSRTFGFAIFLSLSLLPYII